MPARVLIVDDNAQNLKLARVLLGSEGYEVRTATHAEEALGQVAEFDPQVILMDLQIPGVSGLELARRIREQGGARRSIIVVSAYAMNSERETALASGYFECYVTKPIDLDGLLQLVSAQLARITN